MHDGGDVLMEDEEERRGGNTGSGWGNKGSKVAFCLPKAAHPIRFDRGG